MLIQCSREWNIIVWNLWLDPCRRRVWIKKEESILLYLIAYQTIYCIWVLTYLFSSLKEKTGIWLVSASSLHKIGWGRWRSHFSFIPHESSLSRHNHLQDTCRRELVMDIKIINLKTYEITSNVVFNVNLALCTRSWIAIRLSLFLRHTLY